MNEGIEVHQLARSLTKDQRKEILMSFKETDLHFHLKELFSRMEPDYTVEVTHGCAELGKDLVIVKRDSLSIDVIAVIVKVGDIRGRTAGDVDEIKDKAKNIIKEFGKKATEIESQVQQAFEHPAELPTMFSKLPVSKVIVVLSGSISSQARQRLESELEHIVLVFDIEWLINEFTEKYPQLFFEAAAIDFLQERISHLESHHWISKKTGKNLSEYFVDPPIRETDPSITARKQAFDFTQGKKSFPFSEISSHIKFNNRIILCGDPGSGKSNALAKLAIDMYRAAYRQATKTKSEEYQIDIPIIASARDFLDVSDTETLLETCGLGPKVKGHFKVELLLVDALDEVEQINREDVVQKAQDCSSLLGCKLILTSRKIDIIENPPQGFKKYELLPFEFAQALNLFRKLVSNEDNLNDLRSGLDRVKFQIPMVPLSLILLIELVEQQKEIPSSVTELYDRFFDLMLGRWDREKGIEVLFDYIIKKNFLSALAYEEFLDKEVIEIERDRFDSFLKNYADLYGWEENELNNFVSEIERAGIISAKETVLFRHRSFLDYFIAFHLYSRRQEFPQISNMIVERFFDDFWSEVAFYYVGLTYSRKFCLEE